MAAHEVDPDRERLCSMWLPQSTAASVILLVTVPLLSSDCPHEAHSAAGPDHDTALASMLRRTNIATRRPQTAMTMLQLLL
jgi:hypothetical protein